MTRTLEFWETALRDGQQSLWATRMTMPMIAPIADTMGGCGYWCIEVMSGAVYEASYHFNAEDPWERVRLIARASRGNHVAAIIRALSVFGWSTLPDEAFPFAMNVLAGNGITLVNLFDGLNDTANITVPLQAAKERGLHVAATLIFTESPIHTDAYYVAKAKELLALGADSIILEDAASLMTTARLRVLIMKLRSAIGDQALFHFQTHCASGLGALNAIEAMRPRHRRGADGNISACRRDFEPADGIHGPGSGRIGTAGSSRRRCSRPDRPSFPGAGRPSG